MRILGRFFWPTLYVEIIILNTALQLYAAVNIDNVCIRLGAPAVCGKFVGLGIRKIWRTMSQHLMGLVTLTFDFLRP